MIRDKRDIWISLVTIAICAICISGYSYYRSDQGVYLVKALALINPAFCVNDWFLGVFQDYHLFFTYYAAFLGKFLNLHVGMFVSWVILIFGFVWALYRLVGKSDSSFIVLGLTIAFYLLSVDTAWGANNGDLNFFLPGTIAFVISLVAYSFLAEDRYLLSGLVFGLAALVHTNYIPISVLVVVLHYLFPFKRENLRKLFHLLLVFTVVSLPMVLYIFLRYVVLEPDILSEQAYKIFTQRTHKHFLPRTWPLFLHEQMLCVLMMTGIAYWQQKKSPFVKCVMKWIVGILVIFAFVTVVTEFVGPVRFIVSLFLWRLGNQLLLFCYIVIAVLLKQRLEENTKTAFAGFVCLFLVLMANRWDPNFALLVGGCYILEAFVNKSKSLATMAMFYLAPLLFFVALVKGGVWPIPLEFFTAICLLFASSWLVAAVLAQLVRSVRWRRCAGCCLILLLLFLHPRDTFKIRAANVFPVLASYHRWVQSTPPGTVFVTNPGLDDFRIKTGRAQFIDYKAIPRTSVAVLEWARRMARVRDYSNMTPEDFRAIRKDFTVDYVIISARRPIEPFVRGGFSVAYQDDDVAILKF